MTKRKMKLQDRVRVKNEGCHHGMKGTVRWIGNRGGYDGKPDSGQPTIIVLTDINRELHLRPWAVEIIEE